MQTAAVGGTNHFFSRRQMVIDDLRSYAGTGDSNTRCVSGGSTAYEKRCSQGDKNQHSRDGGNRNRTRARFALFRRSQKLFEFILPRFR